MLSISKNSNFFKTVGILCVGLIGVYLLWPLWNETPLSSSFAIACVGLFGIMAIEGLTRTRAKVPSGVVVGYFALLLWMLILAVVYENYHSVHSRSNFLFLNLDSYAMFFVMLFVSCIPAMLYSDIYKIKLNKTTKLLFFLILVTTAYFTMRATGFDINAIRNRQSIENSLNSGILYGTPNYSVVYSFMLLIPFFLHKTLSTNGKNRAYYIVCLALMIYIIIASQLATALVLTLFGVLVYAFFYTKSVAKVLVLVIVLFLGFLVIDNNGYDLLISLSGKVEGSWSVKLVDMAKSLVGEQGSGTVSGRTELYKSSFESFLKSPFVGKFIQNDGAIGNHATAIDVLGLSGIVGFVPFIIAIVCNGYRMKFGSDFDDMKPVIIAIVLQFLVMVFTKNVITALPIFFTFFALVPMLVKSEEKEINEK